ncbi:leucine-rich repeat domain, L domain-like protein [Tanacetum coccineum]
MVTSIADTGLQVIGQFCKKLRKLKTFELVSHMGIIAMAQGCVDLSCLHIGLTTFTNEAMECIGTHLKNLRDFHMIVGKTTTPLDNGVRLMLIGCSKLERLGIHLCPGGLTDVGLGYNRKYGHSLRYLSLGNIGESDLGLGELSKGCPKLCKLKIKGCPFKQVYLGHTVFNIHSLTYMWVSTDFVYNEFEMTRPTHIDKSFSSVQKTCW